MNQKTMRGVVDPYGLGFLIGIIGALITFNTHPHFADKTTDTNNPQAMATQIDYMANKARDDVSE